MRLPYFFFLFLLLPLVPLQAQDNHESFIGPVPVGYKDFVGATILVKSAPLYKSPNSESAILKNLAFRTPVTVTGSGMDEKTKKYWYQVTVGKTVGFLRLQDLAQNSLANEKKKKIYFVQAPIYEQEDSLRVFTYALDSNRFTDTFKLSGYSAELYYRVSLHETALKNADALIRVTHIMPYCGGGTSHTFLADANGEVTYLVNAFAGGDIGYSDVTSIWLPVKTTDGKTQMVEQGDFALFDEQENKQALNVYQVHPSTHIPKEELVILHTVEEETELDENTEPVKNEDGSDKITVVKDVTMFYRWDGKRLLK